jgi:RNA polymerase sigma factor (sigma-70 family)
MRERRERVSFDSEVVEEAVAHPNELRPDELADHLSIQQQLERALDELAPKERAVLLLIKRDGMSYEEAAHAVGVSVHQVERFVTSARSKLKLLLRER